MKCGIVGLPNVGKSTLFNALISKLHAQSEDYPFCTIEPNHGFASVENANLIAAAKIANSSKIIPARIEIVDIAGLVRGASKGLGLGNKFLSHIREVDIILHVVRCFDKKGAQANPLDDIDTIKTELIISDIEMLEKRKFKKPATEKALINKLISQLETQGYVNQSDIYSLPDCNLITSKKVIYVANVSDKNNEHSCLVQEYAHKTHSQFVWVCADIEMQLIGQDKATISEFGIEKSCLTSLTQIAYKLLDLKSFFTIGNAEAKAWTVKSNATALECAQKIHSDIARGFIAAQVIPISDFLTGTYIPRLESKSYLVQPEDIINIRFNV